MAERPRLVSDGYPYLPVRFAIGAFERDASAYVDTGFDGFLIVPENLLDDLPPPNRVQRLQVPSGHVVAAPAYLGFLQILGLSGQHLGRLVAMGEEYILGRRVIDELIVTFERGRRLTVQE